MRIMFLSLVLWTCIFVLPVLLFRMVFEEEPDAQKIWALAALGCLLLGALSRLLIYFLGTKVRCPLCQGAIFQTARCRMNNNARKHLFFSYSTSMILDMFTFRRFVCKYCGTPFRLRK